MRIEVYKSSNIVSGEHINEAMRTATKEEFHLAPDQRELIFVPALPDAYYAIHNEAGVLIFRRYPRFGANTENPDQFDDEYSSGELYPGDEALMISDQHVLDENTFKEGHLDEWFVGKICYPGNKDTSGVNSILPNPTPLVTVS